MKPTMEGMEGPMAGPWHVEPNEGAKTADTDAPETNHASDLLASVNYPGSWDEFVGQEKAKRQIIVACESAKKRGASLGHMLLASGEPGIGKTTMALLTADTMGTGLTVASGQMKINEARIVLSQMQDQDVLFLDEIHQLVARGKTNAEWLLHLLQDGVIMGPRGPEEQPDITVIGATTDAARLPDTIVSRFTLRPVLESYSDEEAALIGIKMATRMFGDVPFPEVEDFREAAMAGHNNPRMIGSILTNLRDLATVNLEAVYDDATGRYDLSEALDWLGLTEDGLTEVAQRYLVTLLNEFQGQAGEKTLADRLQEANLNSVERLLMKRNYIVKTRQGRVLSRDGIRRAQELAKEAA